MRRIVSAVLAAIAAFAATAPAYASTGSGAVQMNWHIPPLLHATVTANYQTGFGPTGGGGSGLTPAAGPQASLQSVNGYVDFGSVVAGYQYLYRYAAQMSVTTNDTNGFQVFAEGATDLNGASSGNNAVPISSVLYWLKSSSGNTPYSAATPFQRTAGTPFNGGQNITYGAGGPPSSALIWSYAGAGVNVAQGFDYQLRLPGTIATDTFTVYVVYTVVGN